MARRITASVMVGREAELVTLRAALAEAHAGTTRSVLVGGEAGVGKSRLVAELAATARQAGWSVHQGACPPVTAGAPVPFAPFTAVLRSLVRSVDARLLDHLLGTGRRELAALLPELGDPDPTSVTGAGAARLFEAVLMLVERTTRRGHGLVLILEDLHWADPSARALLAWLVGELHRVPVMLVATYRTDTDPGDLLPALLVELDRTDGCERLELMPLPPPEADALLVALGGSTLDAAGRAAIVRRAGGIPLYLEELVSAGGDASGPPASVRVAVARRAAALPAAALRIAQLAAVAGRPVEVTSLGLVAGLRGVELTDAVAAAIDAGLVRPIPAPDHATEEVAARHALVAEALVAAMAPGVATGDHATWAATLRAHPELGPRSPVERAATIARHVVSAGDPDAAVPALLAAADAAMGARAFAAADAGYTRALDVAGDRLAQLVADPVAVLGAAAQAAWLAGAPARAVALQTRAIERSGDPPTAASEVRRRVRRAAYLTAAGATDRAVADLRAAIDVAPAGEQRWRALVDLGRLLTAAGDPDAAIAACGEALAGARSTANDRVAARAGIALGVALSVAGRHAEARDALVAARRHDVAAPSRWSGARTGVSHLPDTLARLVDEATLLLHVGDVEGSLAAALRGHAVAQERGLAVGFGAMTAATAAWDLVRLGRWSEADALLESAPPVAETGPLSGPWHAVMAWLAAARGRWDAAERSLDAIAPDTLGGSPGPSWPAIAATAAAQCASGQGRYREARELVRAALRGLDAAAAGSTIGGLAVVGLGVEADAASAARRRGDPQAVADAIDAAMELAARARSAIAADPGAAGPSPWVASLAERIEAELARSRGTDDPATWMRAVEAADAAADAFAAATARRWLAAVLVSGGGDRSRAAAALRDARRIALTLDAAPLTAAIDGLARRARLDLGTDPSSTGDAPGPRVAALALGLSDREVDVLELIALGRTDREIAARLFITEKTAGHHVSHILSKLGVARRGEAAAVAHRLGLDTSGSDGGVDSG